MPISILVISNHNSFRVLFYNIASVIFIWKIYIYILAMEMASPQNQHCATFVPNRWSWRNYVLGLSVRVRVRAYIRSLRACWCGGILRPACRRLLVLNCAMKYQYYVLSWVQWYLKCLGTQGNGVPAPLIIGKWRFWTSKFVKMHRNFYLVITSDH